MQANIHLGLRSFPSTFVELEIRPKEGVFFSFLKDQNANIYFLQETYSEPGDENI